MKLPDASFYLEKPSPEAKLRQALDYRLFGSNYTVTLSIWARVLCISMDKNTG